MEDEGGGGGGECDRLQTDYTVSLFTVCFLNVYLHLNQLHRLPEGLEMSHKKKNTKHF